MDKLAVKSDDPTMMRFFYTTSIVRENKELTWWMRTWLFPRESGNPLTLGEIGIKKKTDMKKEMEFS